MGNRKSGLYAILCALLVAGCILLTRPFVEMGVIDDWSYVKTAQLFARTGHFIYNGWGAVILGWQVPLGALGIKLFGFSFTAERAYMLPVDILGTGLFYLVLARFGLNVRYAWFGALALFLSPICMPLEMISMTDMPGLVVVILCIYLCQQAVLARSPAATLGWLALAASTNVAGGTVRQIAWLGALIMVPSTALLLRKRRGVVAGTVVLGVLSVVAIKVVLRWFAHHPNIVEDHLFQTNMNVLAVAHLFAQLARGFLALQLLLLPLLLVWLWNVRLRSRAVVVRVVLVAFVALAFFAVLPHLGRHHRPETWLEPFSIDVMASLGLAPTSLAEMLGARVVLPMALRIFISALVVASSYAFLEQLAAWAKRARPRWREHLAKFAETSEQINPVAWHTLGWMLAPFVVFYVMFLVPRGISGMLFDRYQMEMLAVGLIVLLKISQEIHGPVIPRISVAALVVMNVFTVMATHDLFALYRARLAAGNRMTEAGLPRTELQGGFEYDAWTQIEARGAIDNDHLHVKVIDLPDDCGNWFAGSSPVVHPRYFLMRAPVPCMEEAPFPQFGYTTWLPPFHRAIMIGQLRPEYRSVPYTQEQ